MEAPEFGQLRQTYSQASDEELLLLVGERESLIAPAQEALQLEIESRALQWKHSSSEPSKPTPESAMKSKAKMFRWLWPVITNEQEAKKAAKGGAYGALFVALCTCVFSLIALATGQPFAGVPGYGLVDAFLFAIIAWRIFRYSYSWAIFGLLLYSGEIFWSMTHDGPNGSRAVATVLIVLSLVASVRGTAFLNKPRRFGFETASAAIICVALIAVLVYQSERADQNRRFKTLTDLIDAGQAEDADNIQKDIDSLVSNYEATDWDGLRNEILSQDHFLVDLKGQLPLLEEQIGIGSCGRLDIDEGDPALRGVIAAHEGLLSFAKGNSVLTAVAEPVLRALLVQNDKARQQWNNYLAHRKSLGCNK